MLLYNEPHPAAPKKGLNIPKLGVILGRTSNKDIQHNGHEPQLKPELKSCSGRVSISCSSSSTRHVTSKIHEHVSWESHWTPVCVNKYI